MASLETKAIRLTRCLSDKERTERRVAAARRYYEKNKELIKNKNKERNEKIKNLIDLYAEAIAKIKNLISDSSTDHICKSKVKKVLDELKI